MTLKDYLIEGITSNNRKEISKIIFDRQDKIMKINKVPIAFKNTKKGYKISFSNDKLLVDIISILDVLGFAFKKVTDGLIINES